jgi:hypothetical protein
MGAATRGLRRLQDEFGSGLPSLWRHSVSSGPAFALQAAIRGSGRLQVKDRKLVDTEPRSLVSEAADGEVESRECDRPT